MRYDIVIAGNMLVDTIKMIEKYPDKGMLANIIAMGKGVGGAVPNTLIDLAVMDAGLKLSAWGAVGSDGQGEFLIGKLKEHGIDTSKVVADSPLGTGFSDVMTEIGTGERTFYHYKGANSQFDMEEVDIDRLDCKLLHVGYVMLLDALDREDAKYDTRLARVLCRAQKNGIKTSIDTVSSECGDFGKVILPVLKYCDYVIINEIEACRIVGINPYDNGKLNRGALHKAMSLLLGYGVKEKVIVHSPMVSVSLSKDGIFTEEPTLNLPDGYIKGAVGAGDAFCAGALYSIIGNKTDKELLQWANASAALNLAAVDSVNIEANADSIKEIMTKYSRRSLC